MSSSQRLGHKKSNWSRFKKGVAVAGAVGVGLLGIKAAHDTVTKKIDEAPELLKQAAIAKGKAAAPAVKAAAVEAAVAAAPAVKAAALEAAPAVKAAVKVKAEKVVEEHGGAARANVSYIADQGAQALAQGGKAAVMAAINPMAPPPVQAAAKAAAAPAMKAKGQAALVAEVGNKDAAAAIEDRYKLHTAPDVKKGGGAGSMKKFACQSGCASAYPKRKGKKYNKCMVRCD